MKRLFASAVCILLSGCTKTIDDIIADEASIKGLVIDVNETSFLMEDKEGTQYVIPKEVEYRDSYGDMVNGDTVVVFNDGTLLESWPVQMHHVYAITLQKPADHSRENQP